MDLIAFLLNIAIVMLSLWMAKLSIDIGNKTENLRWWRVFTLGWVLIAFSRLLTAATYTDLISEPFYRNTSSFMVVIAVCMILYGTHSLARVVVSKGEGR